MSKIYKQANLCETETTVNVWGGTGYPYLQSV